MTTALKNSSRRIRFEVAYKGTAYHGFQYQPTVPTIQGELNRAASKLEGRELKLIGASRTDSGVHARGQCVSVDTEGGRTVLEWFRAINALTPRDITIVRADLAPPGFHPRHSSRGKIYRYLLADAYQCLPELASRAMHVRGRLDTALMERESQALVGEHDFSSFRASDCDANTPVREIYSIRVRRVEEGLVSVEVSGSAFLKYMVRNLVGAMIPVGLARRPDGWLGEVLQKRNRSAASITAASHALRLERIFYPEHPWGSHSEVASIFANPADLRLRP